VLTIGVRCVYCYFVL